MKKISLKSSTKEARTIVKKQIINMLKKGMRHQEIADILSVKKTYVDHISSQYRRNGKKCLSEKKRVRKKRHTFRTMHRVNDYSFPYIAQISVSATLFPVSET